MAGLQSLSRNFAEDRSLLRLLGFEPHIIQPPMKLHLLTKAIPAGKIQAHFKPHLKYQYGTVCPDITYIENRGSVILGQTFIPSVLVIRESVK